MERKTSVLIAERDEPIASLLRSAVCRAVNCDVTVTHDPESAIEALRTRTFDLVLLDIGMASYGMDTLISVRGHNQSCEVIALTTGIIEGSTLKGLAAADVFAVLSKPFDVRQLEKIVVESLRSERTETPNRPLVYRDAGGDATLK